MDKTLRLFVAFSILMLAGCRSTGVIESDVSQYWPGHDALVKVSMSAPAGQGPFPAVILMHGCNGLGWGTTRSMALHVDNLVDAGFVTLVVDSFTSRGIGSTCTSASKMAEATVFRQYDAVHAMRYLQDEPVVDPENIFLMGMSQGGSVAAKLAGDRWSNNIKGDVLDENPTRSWFRAIVAYYPWCPHVPNRLETPLLVLSGKEDDWTPSLGCFWHKAVVKGAPYEVEIYEGAHHSFDLPIRLQAFAGHTVGGNAAAAADSRQKMVEWFLRHIQ